MNMSTIPPRDAHVSPDVVRYAIIAGPDSKEFLTAWIFTTPEDAARAQRALPRGSVVAVLPDAAMAARMAAIPWPDYLR